MIRTFAVACLHCSYLSCINSIPDRISRFRAIDILSETIGILFADSKLDIYFLTIYIVLQLLLFLTFLLNEKNDYETIY